jgi:hypothetical protein
MKKHKTDLKNNRIIICMMLIFTISQTGAGKRIVEIPGFQNKEIEGICDLAFYNLLPGGKTMNVYLDVRDRKIAAALAMSRDYNRVPYDIDYSDVEIKGNRISGNVVVNVNSDGYTPKDGKTLKCRIILDIAFHNNHAEGEYTAAVDQTEVKGIFKAELKRVAFIEPIRLVFDCENAIQDDANSKIYNRRTTLSISFKDGKAYGARFDPVGSIVDVSMQIHVKNADLKMTGPLLKLTTVSQIIRQKGDTITATHIFTGSVIGNVAAGTLRSRFGDKESPESGSFLGKVSDGSDPINKNDCLYSVILYNVLPRGGYFRLFLSASDGKITHGFATSPNSSNFTHSIDISELKINGTRLTGNIKVTLKPDSWTSYKSPYCMFSVSAEIIDKEIIGTYTGFINNSDIKGDLDGSLYPKPTLAKSGKMTIKVENALTGGLDWENRAFLNFEFNGNRISEGNISNNHTDMKGTVDGGIIKFDANQISFEVDIAAAEGAHIDSGKYKIKGGGTVVGIYCAGSFKTFRDDKFIKSGNFWAKLAEK